MLCVECRVGAGVDHGVMVLQEGHGARRPPAHYTGRLSIGIPQPPVLIALRSTTAKLNAFSIHTERHLTGLIIAFIICSFHYGQLLM